MHDCSFFLSCSFIEVTEAESQKLKLTHDPDDNFHKTNHPTHRLNFEILKSPCDVTEKHFLLRSIIFVAPSHDCKPNPVQMPD